MSLRPFPTQATSCPPCCAQSRTSAGGCQWVEDMLAICGGLLFVGVSRHELAAMAPCRRQRRREAQQELAAITEPLQPEFLAEGAEPEYTEYPPLRLVRG